MFSFSVVDAKFPVKQQAMDVKEGQPVVPTYILRKADGKKIDKSVADQERALQG